MFDPPSALQNLLTEAGLSSEACARLLALLADPEQWPSAPARAAADPVLAAAAISLEHRSGERQSDLVLTIGGDASSHTQILLSYQPQQGTVNVQGGTVYGPAVGSNTGTINYNIHPPQPAPPPTPHTIRTPPADFKGRTKEITTLERQLTASSSQGATASICGVRGMGGVGKTVLAEVVAQRLEQHFPDGQILLELRGASDLPLPPEQAIQQVVRALGHEPDPQAMLAELRGLYRSLLRDRRILLLADDARDRAQVEPLIPPPGCALLITSRHFFVLPGMPEPLRLDTLPEKDARSLVRQICPRLSAKDAAQLVKLCGLLPLALRISATLLATSTRPIADYLAELADERTRLRKLRGDGPDGDVAASFNLSYKALTPAAQTLLCRLGVFAAPFDRRAAEQVAGHDPTLEAEHTFDELLDELFRSSLLEFDKNERYSLHDLVRVFALERLREVGADKEQLALLRYATHYLIEARVAQLLFLEGNEEIARGLAIFDAERTHIDAGWQWARQQPGHETVDELMIEYADATVFVGDLRYHKQTERIPQLQAALEAAQRQKNTKAVGTSLGNLGLAYAALGNIHKAIEFYQQSLVIAHEISDYEGAGNSIGNLGNAYAALGDPQRAIKCYEQHLAIAREIGIPRSEGNALGSLGNAYIILGDAQRAIQYSNEHLVLVRNLGDREAESDALGNLGNAHLTLGNYRQAIQFYEQSLVIAREIRDYARQSRILGSLGNAYSALDDSQRAIQFYEQNIFLAHKIGDRRTESIGNWNLGTELAKQGELARAVELMQACVDFEREIGHADVGRHAAEVEKLRGRLAEGDGE